MKKYSLKNPISILVCCLLGSFIFLTACEKDDSDTGSFETNTLTFQDSDYTVSASFLKKSDQVGENSAWEIGLWGRLEKESTNGAKSVSNPMGESNIKISIKLVPVKGSLIKGTYSLGDLNGDGLTNELDATDAGYIASATIEMDQSYSFYSGNVVLKDKKLKITLFDETGQEINDDEVPGFNVQFSLQGDNDLVLKGNVDLVKNDN